MCTKKLEHGLCPLWLFFSFRFTLRTPLGSASGWTALTVRPSWITSKQLLTPRCLLRACSCMAKLAVAVGTLVLVRMCLGNRSQSCKPGFEFLVLIFHYLVSLSFLVDV